MTKTKRFPLRTILTLTTGRLLTKPKGDQDNGIGDLYELLDWMTEDQVFTHQLGRFSQECKPWMYRWFSELEGAESEERLGILDCYIEAADKKPDVCIETWIAYLKTVIPNLKDEYDVPQIPRDDHTQKDPVEELSDKMPKENIIVVGIDVNKK